MTLTLEITSEAVVKNLRERAHIHGWSVEDEVLFALSTLPVTEEEYKRRREKATSYKPKVPSWDGLEEIIKSIPEETIKAMEEMLAEKRRESHS